MNTKNYIKNTILAGLATFYLANPGKAYADGPQCDPSSAESQAPPLRRGDMQIPIENGESRADAIRNRFRNRHLNDRMVQNIEAEALRHMRRNYGVDPCATNYIVVPGSIFNRPTKNNNTTSLYGLTQEDRNRITDTYNRVNDLNNRAGSLDERVSQVGEDLNNFRNEMADDNSEIINRIADRTRQVVHVDATRTIRDSELRDRRQRAAERLMQANRDRNNFVSAGYSWMGENIDGTPYAAGQTLNAELYGSRDIANKWAAFLQADGRLDFLQELNSERNIRSVDLNADAGVRRAINQWLGAEAYLHLDNLAAVIFDNAGDARVNQYSIGPGMGLRLNTANVDANLGVAVAMGGNDTTMADQDALTRIILNAGISYQPNISGLPIELNARYRLENTNLDNGENRSSLQHQITAEALYRTNLVPGLALGAHVEESLRDSEANSDEATTVGGLVKYRF